MRYAILGSVELYRGAERLSLGGPRQRALLADLLVRANQAVSADRLIDDVWGPERSEGSLKRLQMAIARLRSALGPGADGESPLRRTSTGYRLVVAPGELDADVFENDVRTASDALDGGDPRRARDMLRGALELWRGQPLEDVAYESFAQDAIRRLGERRLDACEKYVDADLELGDHADAISRLRELVAGHPTRERLTRQLMLALYRSGRQQDALDAYQQTRTTLGELGLEPGQPLVELELQILRRDPVLAGPSPALPPELRSLATLVGRADEKARLTAAVDAARRGSRAVICLGGEPGVGKSLLVGHAALEAHTTGFVIGWGASLEGVRPPYGTWIAPLSQLADRAAAGVLEIHRGRLSRVIRSLGTWSGPQHADPEGERYLFFDAVVGLLRELAASTPVLVVLDDVHRADADSLALLRYVAAMPDERLSLALVLTYRDSELEDSQGLGDLLTDLHRVGGVTRLTLGGLGAADVAALMAGRSEDAYGRWHHLVEEITAATGGNAFFVGELLHHLESGGGGVSAGRAPRSVAELQLPPSVRDVVRQRIRRLGGRTEEMLGAASVIGQEFDLDVLERLVDGDPLSLVDAAVAAGLLRAHEPGRHVFAHPLIRQTLYQGLSETRRARTHLRIAELLESDADAEPGTLAHHLARSGLPQHERRTAGYARLAGERALKEAAPDAAQRWFAEALRVLLAHGGDEAEQCDVLIGLGEAKRRVGDGTFRCNLIKAARIAARQGDHERLSRAVLANTIGPFGAPGRRDALRLETLEDALRRVPSDWPGRPLMIAVLARELYYGGEPARGSQLSVKALARARRRSDPLQLARVMAMATAISPIAPLAAHQQLVDDLAQLSDGIGDPELRFRAANAAFIYGMHSGDPVPLAAGLQVMRKLDDELHQPILHWTLLWAESAERTLAGDLAGGEDRTTAAELDALRHGRPQARLITFAQLLSIRTEQAALDDLRDDLAEMIAENPHLPVLRLARGFIDAETGRLDSAEAVLEDAAAHGFGFPFDRTLAFSLARCADIAVRVRNRAIAGDLYPRLLPYRDQFATPAGLSSRGSIELSLGRLATLLGDLDAAERHLVRAAHAHERLGAPLLRARSDLAKAEALLARGSQARATEVLDDAVQLALRYGSTAIARDARAVARPRAGIR